MVGVKRVVGSREWVGVKGWWHLGVGDLGVVGSRGGGGGGLRVVGSRGGGV